MTSDAYFVAVGRAERGDGWIVDDLNSACQVDASRIGDAVGSEFINKRIAGNDQRGGAERQVELGRGKTFRPIRPAGMVEGNLGGMDDNAFDVVRDERVPFANVGKRIERRNRI